MAQTWVSKLEDPNYGKLTISTLLKVASAFDVGLQIDFVPYSKVLSDAVYRTSGLSRSKHYQTPRSVVGATEANPCSLNNSIRASTAAPGHPQ